MYSFKISLNNCGILIINSTQMSKLKIVFEIFSSDSSIDELSNDEDSSAPEQSEVELSDREIEEDDKPETYADGDEKKKVEPKSVTVQVN